MRALFIQYSERIRASYWFIPSIMALAATLLALGLIQLDVMFGSDFLGNNPFVYATQPDGARSILNAIGGSMIGVAGTVFSVTMATVVFASGSYGPRLLTNFMNDRGNQITLGIFVATFVYSVLVLRSVRDGGDEGVFADMFVPNLAIYGAIVLAIASIGVLIFFIHHVPSNIHISNVIAGIGHSLVKNIDDTFPAGTGHSPNPKNQDYVLWQVPDCFRAGAETDDPPPYGEVRGATNGYIQVVDSETLMKAAREHELIVRLNCRPGTFVHPNSYLFDVWPSERLNEEAKKALLASLALGNTRSPSQDLFFLIDELVEIAGRALSPGVNDPFTAVSCMDWLGAAFAAFIGRDMPDPLRVDAEGKLRLIAPVIGFAGYLERGFGQLRQYAASDRIAAHHMIVVFGDLVAVAEDETEIAALTRQRDELMKLCRRELAESSLAAVEEASQAFDLRLAHPRRRSGRRSQSID